MAWENEKARIHKEAVVISRRSNGDTQKNNLAENRMCHICSYSTAEKYVTGEVIRWVISCVTLFERRIL
jgi:hypothetical protein